MKKLGFFMILILTGCGSLYSHLIQKQHPAGYSKLITLQPECQSPGGNAYVACRAAADMLENSSPEQAKSKFIEHWQKWIAEGEPYKFARALRNRQDGKPEGKYVNSATYETTLRRDIIAFNKIALPVLKKIFETSSDADASEMLRQVKLTESTTFMTFRINNVQVFEDTETSPQ